jgi:hypothetical protein
MAAMYGSTIAGRRAIPTGSKDSPRNWWRLCRTLSWPRRTPQSEPTGLHSSELTPEPSSLSDWGLAIERLSLLKIITQFRSATPEPKWVPPLLFVAPAPPSGRAFRRSQNRGHHWAPPVSNFHADCTAGQYFFAFDFGQSFAKDLGDKVL